MKCPHCQADLEDNAKFCTNCGKETIAGEQPVPEATPTPTSAPVPTPAPNNVVSQPQKKKNTTLIIVGAILGVVVLIGAGILLVLFTLFSAVKSEAEKIAEPSIRDVTSGDKEIKTVKDPTGHEIRIVVDSISQVKVDTSYLYAKVEDLHKNAKMKTTAEIDASNATQIQKLALKKAIKQLGYSGKSKEELANSLEGEDFDEATIKYAVENCGADWDEQMKIEAYEILAAGGDSKYDLISLLEYRGFDTKKATKMVEDEKFDFYEQAVDNALLHKYDITGILGHKTREESERLLKARKFSEAEVRFALKVVYDELDYEQ